MQSKFPILFRIYVPFNVRRRYEFLKFDFDRMVKFLPENILNNFDRYLQDDDSKFLLKHLYKGENVRSFEYLSFEMTKEMAHIFHTTLSTDTYEESCMYSFVLGWGGTYELADQFVRHWDYLTKENQTF